MRICRASHIWQLPINKSMAGSAGSRSSSIWKYMMMVLHPVIFYNGARARAGLMLASTHNWNSAGIRGSRHVCSAGGRHSDPTQASYGRGVQGGGGLNALKHGGLSFFLIYKSASGRIFVGFCSFNNNNSQNRADYLDQVFRDGKLLTWIYSCDV